MGFVMAISLCFGCKQPFAYNPNTVPSIRHEGVKHPICRECIERVNPIRKANGLDEIVPAPDAYEPISEYEL